MTDLTDANFRLSRPENTLAFYCPQHQLRFRTARGTVIACDQGGHQIGSEFPNRSWWQYCCDCGTFWLSDDEDNLRRSQCVVCERPTVRRYVCSVCQVISIESGGTISRKQFSISAKQGAMPNCPGCATRSELPPAEHECGQIGSSVLTLRTLCPFCEDHVPENEARQTNALVACPHCGTLGNRDIKFCGKCGKSRLQAAAPMTSATLDRKPIESKKKAADSQDQLTAVEASTHERDAQNVTHDAAPASWQLDFPSHPPRRSGRWQPVVIAVGATFLAVVGFAIAFGPKRSKPVIANSSPVPPAGMVYVADGEFTMGTDLGDDYEKPAHRVVVKAFFLDQNEVTCREYEKFVKATNRKPPTGWTNGGCPSGTENYPVINVDWNDASAFAQWAGKRLPTEEEWEFAARGTDGRLYPWGNEWRPNAANAGDSSAGHFTNVGSYPAGKSPFGAMDMVGNAWEWTSNKLQPYPGGRIPKEDLEDGQTDLHVIRGGSWESKRRSATATYRWGWPASGAKDYGGTGFRCAKDL
jgi:formylglycine-generating enzyme required for sulfatase activity